MTNGNESKEPASGPKPKEKQDPTEEDQAQKEGIQGKGNERADRQGAGKKKGEFQPFKLTKMLDKLLRNKQALPFQPRLVKTESHHFSAPPQGGQDLATLSILSASRQGCFSHLGEMLNLPMSSGDNKLSPQHTHKNKR